MTLQSSIVDLEMLVAQQALENFELRTRVRDLSYAVEVAQAGQAVVEGKLALIQEVLNE